MLNEWGIAEERRSVLVSDGAANITLGSELASLEHLHCTIHLLQLAVNDAVFKQDMVDTIVKKCWRIVAPLNKSTKATAIFKGYLEDVPEANRLRLKRDVPTRWNSVLLMLERFKRLEKYVRQYLKESKLAIIIPTREWEMIEMIVKVLKPFYDLTVRLSSDLCSASCVIPEIL